MNLFAFQGRGRRWAKTMLDSNLPSFLGKAELRIRSDAGAGGERRKTGGGEGRAAWLAEKGKVSPAAVSRSLGQNRRNFRRFLLKFGRGEREEGVSRRLKRSGVCFRGRSRSDELFESPSAVVVGKKGRGDPDLF